MAAQNATGADRANDHPRQDQTETNTAIVAAGACLDKPAAELRARHPLSAAFGDMPADEFAELVKDIKRNGLLSAIVTDADGNVLDGWHRYRACVAAGVKPRIEPFNYVIEAAAEDVGRTMSQAEYVCAQNAHRRHLSQEQRRRIVAELLKADPAKSDRAISSMAKVDHKTVAAVRQKAVATGEIPQLSKTTGKDGKARHVKLKVTRAPAVPREVPFTVKSEVKPAPRPFLADDAPQTVPEDMMSALPVELAAATSADAEATLILRRIAALDVSAMTDAAAFAESLIAASRRFVAAPRGVLQ